MQYRRLGKTGLKITEISLGTMAFGRWIDEEASAGVVDRALDAGINLIDTADIYGSGMDNGNLSQIGESESILGRLLKGRRDDVILATKFTARVGPGVNDAGQSRYHLYRALENSLRRLQTDHIDLYQVHSFDPGTPLEETLRALDDLVKQGKIRYIGCSNYAAWQLAKAHGISALHGLHRFESVQPEYSLISRSIERELVPFVQSEEVGVIVYSPLGRGILTGKYRQDEAPPEDSRLAAGEKRLQTLLEANPAYALVEVLRPLAERRGWTLGQYALAWVLSRPSITSAILGASKPQHIEQGVQFAGERLTSEELDDIDTAARSIGLHI
ncbi:Predicted oxidoreductase [Paenibacillus sp. UNCCL117]|uniref:aldo/keto reductase n=1 Tax=unclassified Paenibacillus TaxID=185978 RepID=UPI0008877877|nr:MULTISPECIES: aldo/keto reductase [unclassified Paenibacillus]SDD16981.1 Predicted oxidoreductase [Paenibacillus sp. cl123]SFW34857.1 Predicted oxidoreductase [Paenibacillus sp. UNCCL117]